LDVGIRVHPNGILDGMDFPIAKVNWYGRDECKGHVLLSKSIIFAYAYPISQQSSTPDAQLSIKFA
jgi:hypothetical protein